MSDEASSKPKNDRFEAIARRDGSMPSITISKDEIDVLVDVLESELRVVIPGFTCNAINNVKMKISNIIETCVSLQNADNDVIQTIITSLCDASEHLEELRHSNEDLRLCLMESEYLRRKAAEMVKAIDGRECD